MKASTGVFPVAGFLPEPGASAGAPDKAMLCLLFRDGVTITTDRWPDARAPINGSCGDDDHNSEPATQAKRFARVASTTREEVSHALATFPLPGSPASSTNVSDLHWLDVVRQLYQAAWKSERNVLISAKALSEKAAHKFK